MELDKLKIEILPDGTIKTTADAVSPANHDSAERFLKTIADLAGGASIREARKDVRPSLVHTHDESTHHHH